MNLQFQGVFLSENRTCETMMMMTMMMGMIVVFIVSDSVACYEHSSLSDFKEHVRGITFVISVLIRGLFGGIRTLVTAA